MNFRLQRYPGNPIFSPLPDSPWQSLVVTNPGACFDPDSGEVKMLYRAAGNDAEHKVHLGLATSKDGFHFERSSQTPVFSPSVDGFDAGCVEDPRIIKIEDWYYVTYAARAFPPGQYWIPESERTWSRMQCPSDFPWILRQNATATGLALTQDFRHWIRAGRLTSPVVDDRDVILFPNKIQGRYYMLHRPMSWAGPAYGSQFPAIWITSSDDLLNWSPSTLLAKAEFDWEEKLGGNTPPIRTPHGWLTFYHAVGKDKHYRIGALLLDLEDPTIVRFRTPHWIMEPEQEYELNGPYKGVVFPCGAVVVNNTLILYYGGADKYVGIAYCDLDELLAVLLSSPV